MRRVVPWVLLAVFVGLAVAGLVFGTLTPVFQKAIRICRECIGIG
ncbi:MAG TPA: CD1871A family CXXC motif-containing protein [Planctomycetota bacterium]|nr:CD1871A family CXXC motif-containing protein [Planctomycetota bacterium]